MADTKLTGLPTISTIAVGDIIYAVSDPGGSPISSKITFDNLQKSITDVASVNSAGDVKLPTGNTLYFGTSDVDGSWRVVVSSGTLSFQVRDTGTWVQKGAVG